MLECHIRRNHVKVYSEAMIKQAQQKLSVPSNDENTTQSSITGFVVVCPQFESCLLKWMIKTYQPLRVTECNEFRMMCLALNKNSPILGSERLCRLLKTEYHLVQAKLVFALKGKHYALTTDAWTSIAKVGYVTCTVHFIDHDTWKLHSLVLGLYEKTGRSRAVDCVEYAEQQL